MSKDCWCGHARQSHDGSGCRVCLVTHTFIGAHRVRPIDTLKPLNGLVAKPGSRPPLKVTCRFDDVDGFLAHLDTVRSASEAAR